MKQERIRSEVEEQAKWNLKAMYQNEEAVNKEIEQLKQYHKDLLSFKGKIMESSETLKKFYQVYINYDKVLSNLYTYSHMLCDEDTTDSNHQAFKMKIDKLVEDLGAELSFISPEMMATSYDEVLKMIEQDTSLKEYQFDLEKSFRYQDHVLSTREEELIAKASNAMGTGDEVFYNLDNSDIHLRPIHDEQGNLVELNNSNYNKYMNSKNREVRKEAFDSMYEYWKNLKNTVAATYKGQIKEDFFSSEMRKFDSPLKESLYSDNIDISVYECLIQTVHKNLDKMYQYVDLRKQILGVDELHMYDVYVDLCEEEAKPIPFEEGKQIVFDALKPLGETYLKDLNKAFEERWIDIYPNTGKKSGAYSWGTYDSYPYLLLNYNDTVDSVSTMAHELGHSMHSYYSNQNQEYLYHNYPIFLAEIASTVNEILLNDYLYKNAQSKSEKMLYLNEF